MSGCFPWWKGGGSTDKKKKGATISRDANIRVTALKMKLQQGRSEQMATTVSHLSDLISTRHSAGAVGSSALHSAVARQDK